MEKCDHGFHDSRAEDLSPIRDGIPIAVCPKCKKNLAYEEFLEACKELGIDPAMIDPNVRKGCE